MANVFEITYSSWLKKFPHMKREEKYREISGLERKINGDETMSFHMPKNMNLLLKFIYDVDSQLLKHDIHFLALRDLEDECELLPNYTPHLFHSLQNSEFYFPENKSDWDYKKTIDCRDLSLDEIEFSNFVMDRNNINFSEFVSCLFSHYFINFFSRYNGDDVNADLILYTKDEMRFDLAKNNDQVGLHRIFNNPKIDTKDLNSFLKKL